MRRKKERRKQGQTNKAKQHSTHKTVTFPRKAASGGTRTHDTLHSRQSDLPTELPRQLSWLGPNVHASIYPWSECVCSERLTNLHNGFHVVLDQLIFHHLHNTMQSFSCKYVIYMHITFNFRGCTICVQCTFCRYIDVLYLHVHVYT